MHGGGRTQTSLADMDAATNSSGSSGLRSGARSARRARRTPHSRPILPLARRGAV